jgi:hypothetical protein
LTEVHHRFQTIDGNGRTGRALAFGSFTGAASIRITSSLWTSIIGRIARATPSELSKALKVSKQRDGPAATAAESRAGAARGHIEERALRFEMNLPEQYLAGQT